MQQVLSCSRLRRSICAIAATFALLVGGCGGGSVTKHERTERLPSVASIPRYPSGRHGGALPRGANIVFVLTDDLSMNLLRFMPHVRAMERDGLTFRNYFVSDSLCCPSRATILTGNFPHDTGVYGNYGRHGGFDAFYTRGEQQRTFAVALQRAGYLTALMGKYLNGYMGRPGTEGDGASNARLPQSYVPPGWTAWDAAGWGYPEFDYRLNENGSVKTFRHRPSDYLTDVLTRRGTQFISRAARRHKPFFLELATFAPHHPYVPAPRNAHDFPGLRAPRPPSFDVMPSHAPRWLAGRPHLTRSREAKINRVFRRRAQSVEAVDRMIGRVEAELRARGLAKRTYLIFSSDNGLHTGEYRLMPGKLTAFDTDIHVPLVVVGPGVPRGRGTPAMAENTDLAETFAAIGGTHLAADGHGLLGLLRGRRPRAWRNAILIEHRGSLLSVLDPDFQQSASGSPTSYEAMRTPRFLYVEYIDGERELYDLRTDPFELHNIAGHLTASQLLLLHSQLAAMRRCHSGESCWRSEHVVIRGGI